MPTSGKPKVHLNLGLAIKAISSDRNCSAAARWLPVASP